MPTAAANGIDLYWEEFGPPDAPPMLLISGLGSQCLSWRDDFCAQLAATGRRVIRFDNRDVGLSSWFDHHGDPMPGLMAALGDEEGDAPYLLADMAADCAGLLDALAVDAADIVGSSMGGMVAQQFAIDHPERTRSLTSIMSTTGEADLPEPSSEAVATLMAPTPADRDGYIAAELESSRMIASPVHFDDDTWREYLGRVYDRAFHPDGSTRQLTAVMASGDRAEGLRSVAAPTLVIHGAVDPLVPIEAGRRTAELVEGAELLVLDDMAHDLPPARWPSYIDAIGKLTGGTNAPASF